jgi:hypothetical protein
MKCTSKAHENFNAVVFCQECKIYMCSKCEAMHSVLFTNHNTFKSDKDIQDIFTGFCKIENHINKIEYFCKDHNQLCCGLCISKIEGKGNGQHNNCNICFIEDIKEEKKNKLNDNIKYLKELSKNIDESINNLKKIFDEIIKNKEELKLEIQKIFTGIRNEINMREDKILSEVDNKFDTLYFKEDLIKAAEKIPKNIKISLENGLKMNNEWNENDKLSLVLNDCINIEKTINDMILINKSVQKNKKINKEIKFSKNQNETLINLIKEFGNIEIINKKKKSENEKQEIDEDDEDIGDNMLDQDDSDDDYDREMKEDEKEIKKKRTF